MEPLTVLPYDDDDEDMDVLNVPDSDDEELLEENQTTVTNIQSLQEKITDFKRALYFDLVSNDTKHDSSDLGGMMTFHALFLQCVGYWIGCLDSRPVPIPTFSTKQHTARFLDITKDIQTIRRLNVDARIMLYSMLFNFSIQHPYDLGRSKKKASITK
jgi:hypothetical protein